MKRWTMRKETVLILLGAGLVMGPNAHQKLEAQESLAGVGAATAAGATLGAAAGSSLSTGGARGPRGSAQQEALIAEAGNAGGGLGGGVPGAGTAGGPAFNPNTYVVPAPPGSTLSGASIVGRLRAASASRSRTRTTTRSASPRQQARNSRQTTNASKTARTRQVQQQYQIPPVGWRAKYLPADRYKLGKVWAYVSTQDSSFYYRPQDLARRQFNPNRVIGFHSWQAALLAGYQPDPLSKPEPAPAILQLSDSARGPNFYRFVEYVYAGRVSPQKLAATSAYAREVAASIRRYRYARGYVSPTLDRVFLATLTGNTSVIPRTIGGSPRVANSPAGAAPTP